MADRKQIVLPTISSLTDVPTGLKYLTLPEGILELIEVVNLICVKFSQVDQARQKEFSYQELSLLAQTRKSWYLNGPLAKPPTLGVLCRKLICKITCAQLTPTR